MSKICLKCNREFPITVVVDGKRKNLNSRKYCLKCSPFGLHNTNKLHKHPLKITENRTVGCKFDSYCVKHGNTQFVIQSTGTRRCMKCRVAAVVKARRNRKKKLVMVFGGCCMLCGYNKCVQALQFHHKDPKTKKYGLAEKGSCRSWKEMLAEAKKCVLLCANCHFEVENGITKLLIE